MENNFIDLQPKIDGLVDRFSDTTNLATKKRLRRKINKLLKQQREQEVQSGE